MLHSFVAICYLRTWDGYIYVAICVFAVSFDVVMFDSAALYVVP
jgi:hypothetical protein